MTEPSISLTANILTALAAGVLGSLITSVVSAITQSKIQKRQIITDRENEIRRERQKFAIEAEYKMGLLIIYLSKPHALREIIKNGLIDFFQLLHDANKAITALSLICPKKFVDDYKSFAEGTLNELLQMSGFIMVLLNNGASGAPYNDIAEIPSFQDALKMLDKLLKDVMIQYEPLHDQLREYILSSSIS